jgi:hypothetical protein
MVWKPHMQKMLGNMSPLVTYYIVLKLWRPLITKCGIIPNLCTCQVGNRVAEWILGNTSLDTIQTNLDTEQNMNCTAVYSVKRGEEGFQ